MDVLNLGYFATDRYLPLIACNCYLGPHSKPLKLLDIGLIPKTGNSEGKEFVVARNQKSITLDNIKAQYIIIKCSFC